MLIPKLLLGNDWVSEDRMEIFRETKVTYVRAAYTQNGVIVGGVNGATNTEAKGGTPRG